MKRRTLLRGMLGATGFPAVLRGLKRPADEKPNLLFLWTDQQRADTMAVYGNHRFHVPAMNRLASTSIVFEKCYVTQPICTPSRSSVMTGLWPHTNGCITNNIPLRSGAKTFPELLADPAYRTGYFGKWHLGDEVFAQHGFEEWVSVEDLYFKYFTKGRDRSRRSSYDRFLRKLGYEPDDKKNDRFSRVEAVRKPLAHCKPVFLAMRATDFILRHRNEAWILYVNFLEPHPPFYGRLNDLHNPSEAPLPPNYPGIPIEGEPTRYQKIREKKKKTGVGNPAYLVLEGHAMKNPADFQRLSRNYAGLCSQVDQAIARILWTLEASGQADNTIVVYTSDHGEMMGAHSLVGKAVMYEEAVRVPLLLRVPFAHSRQIVVEQPVSNVDIVPTLLELMGKRPPEFLQGRSLLPLVNGTARGGEPVFIEWHTPPDGPNGRAVVTVDGWKLALYDTDNCLLFDRTRDPLEMHNLYYRSEYAQVRRELRRQIEAWQARTSDVVALPSEDS